MKRLVVCCDGTWNTADQTDNGVPTPTNVVRLYNAVLEKDGKGIEQLKYYHPGVGTDPGLLSKMVGGGLGAGLDSNIKSAYRYLADNYRAGDEIYLFGFSRGAYTVRSLAGMVGRCGLIDPSAMPNLDEAGIWALIDTIYKDSYRARKAFKNKNAKFHAPPSGEKVPPIHFIGVWDTVGALGIPDDMALLNLLDNFRDRTFHDTKLGANIRIARHAVAMDEMRASFQPTLWKIDNKAGKSKTLDVMQVWFPGVHSDVGGGYIETGLSDGALEWMLQEAEGSGSAKGAALAFDKKLRKQIKPDHHSVLHNSLDGVFKLLPTMPRSVPNLAKKQPDLHTSAVNRFNDPPITQSPYRSTRVLKAGDSVTVNIFAVEPWNDTGIYLEAGKAYTLSAEGQWLDKGVSCGPEGADDGNFQIGEVAHLMGSALGQLEGLFKHLGGNNSANFIMTKRHEKFPWFCLVGAIANGQGVTGSGASSPHETKKIGALRKWKPGVSGYLYAYANDAWRFYGNNKGHVRLTVSR